MLNFLNLASRSCNEPFEHSWG